MNNNGEKCKTSIKYDVISDFCFVVPAKNDCIGKVIVISLFLNELSSNLV